MSMRLSLTAAAALLIAAGSVTAQSTPAAAPAKQPDKQTDKQAESKPLTVGDKAPAIQVEKWIKGEPVTGFEKGRVYVIEFWATWCGPCIAAFPHLSELQAHYKDKVTIIGVNIWEDARGRKYTEETHGKIVDFVKEQADRMSYTVAYDGATKHMDKSYMKAAGRRGIPSAFIVNQEGTVVWMGHPGSMDSVLEAVVNGTFDMKDAGVDTKIEKALQDSDSPESLLAAFDKIEKEHPSAKAKLDEIRWRVYASTGDAAKAAPLLRTQIDSALAKTKPDAQELNALAWTMVDPDGPFTKETRDLDAALKAAKKAVELTSEKEAAIIDTLARVHFLKGDIDKAIELQTKAVALSPEEMKEQLTAALDEYKAAKKSN